MGIRARKPTSPGRRFQTVSDFAEVTKDRPEKSLRRPKPKSGGRNAHGRKTSRHRGGGHKQQYRVIDFKRTKDGVTAKVAAIEYDPNRTCRIALLHYADGEKAYILAPRGLRVGDHVMSGHGADIKPGNALPMRYIPVGTTLHNVELRPGQGGKIGRSAGIAVQLVAKDGDWATLRMPSTEMRRVQIDCRATVGEVGNAEHELVKVGKAGRNRWKGVRPQTRGVAMNPVDHPLGGGEGRSSGGRPAVSPWGKPEGRTRDKNKPSQSLIVRRRRTGKGRGKEVIHVPQPEEGPVRRRSPAEEDRRAEHGRRAPGHQDVVAPLDDHPRHGRPHHRRPRRSQARAGVRHRVDGRPQARRVQPDADLPVPRRPGEGREGAALMTGPKLNDGVLLAGDRPSTRATAKYLRGSASKAREVLDLIRGLDVRHADEVLQFTRRDVAGEIRKVLASAVANAVHNDEQDADELFVVACYADEGPTLRRFRPGPAAGRPASASARATSR